VGGATATGGGYEAAGDCPVEGGEAEGAAGGSAELSTAVEGRGAGALSGAGAGAGGGGVAVVAGGVGAGFVG
jgi:hypothetical protein